MDWLVGLLTTILCLLSLEYNILKCTVIVRMPFLGSILDEICKANCGSVHVA